MRFPASTIHAGKRALLSVCLLPVLLTSACRSRRTMDKPAIVITHVPHSSTGGPFEQETIDGRATGAGPGQKVVIYARNQVWWVQPFRTQSDTTVRADGSWANATHLGTEYAALLVEASYQPIAKVAELPPEGKGVIAVVTAKGQSAPPSVPKILHFSGYDWRVRRAGSLRGGETHAYDPANAWTDEKGYLHLRVQPRDGQWQCAEVSLLRSLGYGTYRFVVKDTSHLGPYAVLGMFTLDEMASDETRQELDIEVSQWGNPQSKNAQYVVQPYYVPENIVRFEAPAGELSHVLHWEPGTATFETTRGPGSANHGQVVSEHIFTTGVPAPALETLHIEMYNFFFPKTLPQEPAEVIIEKFEYLP